MNRRWLFFATGLLAVLAWMTWQAYRDSPRRAARHTRELATWGLARELVRQASGRQTLVLANPFAKLSEIDSSVHQAEDAGLWGLRRGFAESLPIQAVVAPDLRPGALTNPRSFFIDPETTTPLSYLVAPDAVDRAFHDHPDCDIIVSLIGLPVDLSRVAAWQADGPPRFALLLPDLRLLGGLANLRAALARGKLAALVLARPGAPDLATGQRGDWDEQFQRHFLLVTSNTIESVVKSYPGLFRSR